MRDSIEHMGPSPSGQLSGRHVLIIFCSFFGIIFAVNGYFLVTALATHTGVVAIEPYRKGLAYNTRIAASDAQLAQGWSDLVTADGDGGIGLEIRDARGLPISGLIVTGSVGRPATAREDHPLAFEELPGGRYRANLVGLAQGAWIVTLEARRRASDPQPDYRSRRRLWLQR